MSTVFPLFLRDSPDAEIRSMESASLFLVFMRSGKIQSTLKESEVLDDEAMSICMSFSVGSVHLTSLSVKWVMQTRGP